jgi:hypothetical protein
VNEQKVRASRIARLGSRRSGRQHTRLDPLHGAAADAERRSDLEHAQLSARQGLADSGFGLRINLRPSDLFALRPRSCQAGIDALPDHVPLELGKGAADVEQQFPRGRRCVDVLLIQVQIAPPT